MSDFNITEKDGITYIISKERNPTAITKIVAVNFLGKIAIATANPKYITELIHNKLLLVIAKTLQIPPGVYSEMKGISGDYNPKTKEITWRLEKDKINTHERELIEIAKKKIIPKRDLQRIKVKHL